MGMVSLIPIRDIPFVEYRPGTLSEPFSMITSFDAEPSFEFAGADRSVRHPPPVLKDGIVVMVMRSVLQIPYKGSQRFEACCQGPDMVFPVMVFAAVPAERIDLP
jgi:hypothetical protein